MENKCKVADCSHSEKKSGFCGWCFNKYERGIYEYSGELTLKEMKKVKARKNRELKRKKKEELLVWKKRKEGIKRRLSRPMLKVLQEEHPETRTTVYCKTLEFSICEAACYYRMFLTERHSECLKCHNYDERLDFLEDFISNEER